MEMDATAVAEIIQLIVAPVVMVIATAHILNAMLGRYRTLTNLLRMMAQERIQLRADRERTLFLFQNLLIQSNINGLMRLTNTCHRYSTIIVRCTTLSPLRTYQLHSLSQICS